MISVIIPLFNAEKTVRKALDSVKNQTADENFEIFVVNDGSTDSSKETVQQYILQNPGMNIILLNQENKGVSAARNAGLKRSSGEFIALLDADDEWLPAKTERQMKYLNNEELNIDVLGTMRNGVQMLYPYSVKNNLAEVTFKKLLLRNELQPSTVIFKKKILANTGFFDDNQRYAEDVNFWLKISQHNKIFILAENLVFAGEGKRSFGVSGLSANLKEMKKGYRKNLVEMKQKGRIGNLQLYALLFFYNLKYWILLLRRRFT